MTGQSNDAAERSAHVTRGGAGTASDALPPVVEWRNAAGQTVAAARGAAELRAENARLQSDRDTMRMALVLAQAVCGQNNCNCPRASEVKRLVGIALDEVDARAALTPRPPRADGMKGAMCDECSGPDRPHVRPGYRSSGYGLRM